MKHRKWITASFSLALFTAGCATAFGNVKLEGLESLSQQGDPASLPGAAQLDESLQVIADEAEAAAPFLDIVQISIDDQNDLVIFALFAVTPTGETAIADSEFQITTETIWQAAIDQNLSVNNFAVAFMQVFPVNTLDRGLAPGGWLIGGISVNRNAATDYLSGAIDDDTRTEFWVNGPVESVPLDQPYVGLPNHPLRSLEA